MRSQKRNCHPARGARAQAALIIAILLALPSVALGDCVPSGYIPQAYVCELVEEYQGSGIFRAKLFVQTINCAPAHPDSKLPCKSFALGQAGMDQCEASAKEAECFAAYPDSLGCRYEPECTNNPPECEDDECRCKPEHAADPVDITSRSSFLRRKDATISTTDGDVALLRTYYPADNAWNLAIIEELNGIPKPFGEAASVSAMHWWHNYFSYVLEYSFLFVRNKDGRMSEFAMCTPANGECEASPRPAYAGTSDRLRLIEPSTNSKKYVLRLEDGYEYEFAAKSSLSDGRVYYFLTSIRTAHGRVLAEVSYALPTQDEANNNITCGAAGSSNSHPGAPFIERVTASNGSAFKFHYAELPKASGQGTECALRSVTVECTNCSGSTPVEVARFTYALDSNNIEHGGWLASATTAGSVQETYAYPNGGFNVYQDGHAAVAHDAPDGGVTQAVGQGMSVNFSYTYTDGGTVKTANYVDTAVSDGLGGSPSTGLLRTFVVAQRTGTTGARATSIADACGTSMSCSPGTRLSVHFAIGRTDREFARRDKRGSYTVNSYAQAPDGGIEMTAVERGAQDMSGTNALQKDEYGYEYGSGNRQRLKKSKRKSLNPAASLGDFAETEYTYDSAGRVTRELRNGWTRDLNASQWSERKVATYFEYCGPGEACSGPTQHQRQVSIRGPCAYNSTINDCPAGPLVENIYYASNEANSNRGQLKQVKRYASSSVSLATTYEEYDVFGRPGKIIDPNGVETTYTYDAAGRVTKKSVHYSQNDVRETLFGYENGKLTTITHPEGNAEVFCYRDGAPIGTCTGAWTPLLQWKTKAADASGAPWFEAVKYTYWPDQTIHTEEYWSNNGEDVELRRVKSYTADAHRRPAREWWGDGSGGSFISTRRHDASDNLAGVGLPYNNDPLLSTSPFLPNDFCATDPKRCSMFEHDRLNRSGYPLRSEA